jgi:hypothetical protein
MTNTQERNTALYKKMSAEQEVYRDWLLAQSPEEILRHTYEYTVREDILLSLEYNDLTAAQAEALLSSPSPLEDVFRDFEKIESDHMEILWGCLEGRANGVLETQRETLRNTPVYPLSAAEAHQRGERETYFASRKANIACKKAIEQAIRDHYRDNRLDARGVAQVVETYGAERTLYVLANTVRYKDWDTRFSPDNRAWAATVPVCENRSPDGANRNADFVVESHPGLVDMFVTQTRREVERCQERPSVREKLKAQPVNTPRPPHRPKEQER